MSFKSRSDIPDLHTQLESLLDQVWRSESDWRLWDRVDAAVRLESMRARRSRGASDQKPAISQPEPAE
ncbi:MAG TPA: hypothetical protein VG009_05455 [Candidatus Dormibacteraeota bacterium]|nr:hypothetical protein [Candidatus Dormibacteraeota bacterium]